MTTADVIRPILVETYGDGSMVHSLADHLAEKIDAWPEKIQPNYYASTREDMILRTCWDWMSGGTTAEAVAAEIEDALRHRPKPIGWTE